MNKNNSQVLLLGESHPARYVLLSPDFETGMLIETDAFKKANRVTFFGLQFSFEHKDEGNAIEYDNNNERVYRSLLSKKAFKDFVEKLQKKAIEAGADFVLVKVIRNSQAMNHKWVIQAQCQFLVDLYPSAV